MKTFSVATLLVLFIFVAADISAEEMIPWSWDEEEVVNAENQEDAEKIAQTPQVEITTDLESDIGW